MTLSILRLRRRLLKSVLDSDAVNETVAKGNLAIVYIVLVTLFDILVLACKHLCNFFF